MRTTQIARSSIDFTPTEPRSRKRVREGLTWRRRTTEEDCAEFRGTASLMRADAFRAWLTAQGQAKSSVSTRVSDARRVESHYGDLDEAYETDRFEAILKKLEYSAADRAANRPNPSELSIDGNLYDSLASYRAAVTAYRRFAEDGAAELSQADRIRRFALETVIAQRVSGGSPRPSL
ncbi:unnamed protein product [Sordaria macrospora k-hell]|uniref:WGS project CABT00000000 data, contig 2.332 n=1 Tax=Sordaria macrospora (strain ATCC MYA-333 / DSM 997 / K(L3346) / K-hell) TaxID=771870 RepID=F7WCX0_SORMK|nr:uncharacterized protein SMAC_10097 [Sordaria macrospora k-hell]CCC14657.1 unnamed protein product [Sordaria macrospora k-hell]